VCGGRERVRGWDVCGESERVGHVGWEECRMCGGGRGDGTFGGGRQ